MKIVVNILIMFFYLIVVCVNVMTESKEVALLAIVLAFFFGMSFYSNL